MNSTGAIYNDFNGLANLKAKAGEGENNPEVTRETARQFEALFVQMMLKSMRSAGGEFSEKRDTTYEEMFDQQIAIEMTSNRGIGIADMLVRQLNNGAEPAAVESGSAAVFDASAARYYGPDQSVKTGSNDPEPMARMDWKPGSPDEFIQDIWPHAEEAADKLGIDPRTLIAQAALETGWGQKLIRDGSGISGNNLFGIKADTRWDGESVKVSTLEYEKGSPYRIQDDFRAYTDLQAGFKDYVDFLKGNPRYEHATRGGLTPEEYATSLQDAGYATDPRYAEKIKDIVESPRLNDLVGQLKIDGDQPI